MLRHRRGLLGEELGDAKGRQPHVLVTEAEDDLAAPVQKAMGGKPVVRRTVHPTAVVVEDGFFPGCTDAPNALVEEGGGGGQRVRVKF